MRFAAVLTAVVALATLGLAGGTKTATAPMSTVPSTWIVKKQIKPQAKKKVKRVKRSPYKAYLRYWEHRDNDTKKALKSAAFIFRISHSWLSACNDAEGGHNDPEVLRWSLRTGPHGRGWNTSGSPPSNAFGAMQFMLDRKPAPNPGDWGTYERYAPAAFGVARARGYWVPARYNTPASNVGQAITAAFMFAIGESGQWAGAGC